MLSDHKNKPGRPSKTRANKRRIRSAEWTRLFNIQALFLVETIAMLNPCAQTPIVVNLLYDRHGRQGDIGDQTNCLLIVWSYVTSIQRG